MAVGIKELIRNYERRKMLESLPEERRETIGAVYDFLDKTVGVYLTSFASRITAIVILIIFGAIMAYTMAGVLIVLRRAPTSPDPVKTLVSTFVFVTALTAYMFFNIRTYNRKTKESIENYNREIEKAGLKRPPKSYPRMMLWPLYAVYAAFIILILLTWAKL